MLRLGDVYGLGWLRCKKKKIFDFDLGPLEYFFFVQFSSNQNKYYVQLPKLYSLLLMSFLFF